MTIEEELTEAIRRAEIAIEALMILAAYNDVGGNARLAATGSYASFDEPFAAELARNTISRISP